MYRVDDEEGCFVALFNGEGDASTCANAMSGGNQDWTVTEVPDPLKCVEDAWHALAAMTIRYSDDWEPVLEPMELFIRAEKLRKDIEALYPELADEDDGDGGGDG